MSVDAVNRARRDALAGVSPVALAHVPARLPFDLARAHAQGVLLRTVVGSRLHGFGHPGSDLDVWVVVPEPRDWTQQLKARQAFQAVETASDGSEVDVTVLGLSTFWRYCEVGTPQALDVLWSPLTDVDLLGPVRWAYRPSVGGAVTHFRRFMAQIVRGRAHESKQRRHAFRLAVNLLHLREHGWYSPVLSAEDRERVLVLAAEEEGFRVRLEAVSCLTFPET